MKATKRFYDVTTVPSTDKCRTLQGEKMTFYFETKAKNKNLIMKILLPSFNIMKSNLCHFKPKSIFNFTFEKLLDEIYSFENQILEIWLPNIHYLAKRKTIFLNDE